MIGVPGTVLVVEIVDEFWDVVVDRRTCDLSLVCYKADLVPLVLGEVQLEYSDKELLIGLTAVDSESVIYDGNFFNDVTCLAFFSQS